MRLTKNVETLNRRFDKLGVSVVKVASTVEGYLIADGFRCHSCNTVFMPNGIRNRHRCPYGCNRKECVR